MALRKLLTPSFVTLCLTLFLTISGTYVTLAAANLAPAGNLSALNIFIAISLGGSIAASFYAGFHRGLFLKKMNPFADPRSLISELAIVQIGTVMLFISHKISPGTAYVTLAALLSWTSWLGFSIAANGLNINPIYTSKLPKIAFALVASCGFFAMPFHNFWPFERLILATALAQSIVHIIGLMGVLCWFTLIPKYRLDHKSLKNSFILRLNHSERYVSEWTTSFIAAMLQLSVQACAMYWILNSESTSKPFILTLATPVLFVPSLIDAWTRLDRLGSEQDKLLKLSRLSVMSARKLLSRHNYAKDHWAATVGLRTATFTIDHDPDAVIGSKIPATLMRIRNEEILGFVNQVTKHQALALNSMSQKIIGTIDPEHSIRPCVDTLKLCASLYLDAGALVERRLAGLVSLLPIVNPGLADVIKMENLMPLLKRTQWFFHFDFSWVDQSIVNTPSAARYGIHLDPIAAEVRIAMLEQMRKNHSVGNFIWIGKDAHERLLQEAPNLATIMEPHTIKTQSDFEILVFSMKFEMLIPRLQRYYGLDDTRAKIIDFEPSFEAQQLLTILAIQIQNETALHERVRLTESIASYNWRGYKEKDQALKLILKIFESEISDSPQTNLKSNEMLVKKLRDAATTIGYPSQMMNQAHMYKVQLRDIPKLRASALDITNSRFEEAWVLLGNLDYRRYTDQETQSIREIISDAVRSPVIMRMSVVHSKLIDSVVSLVRRSGEQNRAPDIKLLIKVVEGLIHAGSQSEIMTLAIDAFTFIAQLTGLPIPTTPIIENYFEQLMKNISTNTTVWDQSLWSRWQEYKSKYSPTHINEKKAS